MLDKYVEYNIHLKQLRYFYLHQWLCQYNMLLSRKQYSQMAEQKQTNTGLIWDKAL